MRYIVDQEADNSCHNTIVQALERAREPTVDGANCFLLVNKCLTWITALNETEMHRNRAELLQGSSNVLKC
jgi:hypothetical protein